MDDDVSRQLDGLLLQTCRIREIVDMVLDAQNQIRTAMLWMFVFTMSLIGYER